MHYTGSKYTGTLHMTRNSACCLAVMGFKSNLFNVYVAIPEILSKTGKQWQRRQQRTVLRFYSIVDAVSFLWCIVVWCKNKFSPKRALAGFHFLTPTKSGSSRTWNSGIRYKPNCVIVVSNYFNVHFHVNLRPDLQIIFKSVLGNHRK